MGKTARAVEKKEGQDWEPYWPRHEERRWEITGAEL